MALALPIVGDELSRAEKLENTGEYFEFDAPAASFSASPFLPDSFDVSTLIESLTLSPNASPQKPPSYASNHVRLKNVLWGSQSNLTLAPFDNEEDPERLERVNFVIALAESERQRRIEEEETSSMKHRLKHMSRVEWAVAFKEERKRMEARKKEDQSLPLYLQDYEVICPYIGLGCEAVIRRSELLTHLSECSFKAEVVEVRAWRGVARL